MTISSSDEELVTYLRLPRIAGFCFFFDCTSSALSSYSVALHHCRSNVGRHVGPEMLGQGRERLPWRYLAVHARVTLLQKLADKGAPLRPRAACCHPTAVHPGTPRTPPRTPRTPPEVVVIATYNYYVLCIMAQSLFHRFDLTPLIPCTLYLCTIKSPYKDFSRELTGRFPTGEKSL